MSWLRYARLAHLSKPRSVRPLYRLVKRHKICRIVEVGISKLERSVALVGVAERFAPDGRVLYAGLDWFDVRPAGLPAFSLKQAYRRLQTTGATIRLVPGEPARSLAVVANAHQRTGLVVISAAIADDELAAGWFYLPRMLCDTSIVVRERLDAAGEPVFERLSATRIAELAGPPSGRHAA